jgi:hypothetical protein
LVVLYLNGQEASNSSASGTIITSSGPLLMGNDGSHRLFNGRIDNAFFADRALSAGEIIALTCVHHDATVVGTPPMSVPTNPGVPATFDIAVSNNDSPSCGPSDFFFQTNVFVPGIDVEPPFQLLPQIAAGMTAHLTLTVTASDEPDPGTYPIPFFVFSATGMQMVPAMGSVDFVLAASGCRVSTRRELMITDLSVVDDPVRTTFSSTSTDPRNGVWTFRHLMESIAPTPDDAPAMVEAMLSTFTTSETINSFAIDPRPGMQALVLDQWPRINGRLDLSQAPLKLQAIVNRIDLESLAAGDAGEGRFVFAFIGPDGVFPLQATLIFEFKLPAATAADAQNWANRWHALGAISVPSESYNAALQAITEGFAARGARRGHPNGSAINAVRTNEIAFSANGIWQMREFTLSPMTGLLTPDTIKLTPDRSFNNTPTLAAFINANEAAILADAHTVPDQFQGMPFETGAVFNDLTTWFAPGINNNEARFHFAVNTCNGCHSAQETNTVFLQITPRTPGTEAILSAFLTGTTVFDPVTNAPRTLNELGRRSANLRTRVCP